jgi:hypothetical protein
MRPARRLSSNFYSSAAADSRIKVHIVAQRSGHERIDGMAFPPPTVLVVDWPCWRVGVRSWRREERGVQRGSCLSSRTATSCSANMAISGIGLQQSDINRKLEDRGPAFGVQSLPPWVSTTNAAQVRMYFVSPVQLRVAQVPSICLALKTLHLQYPILRHRYLVRHHNL